MSDPALLAAITDYKFDQWRASYPDAVIDLSGADLRGLSLSNIPLQKANLSGATLDDFIAVSLEGATLRDARSDQVNGSGPSFINASFRGADLTNASLERAVFHECDFTDAVITGGRFKGSHFHNCTFDGAHVSEDWATLPPADIIHATILYAGHAEFSECHFTECRFVSSKLMGADFSKAQILQCNFSNAILDRASLNRCRLSKSTFDGTSLAGAALVDAEASESSFRGANLANANLEYADFGAQHVIVQQGLTMTPGVGMRSKSTTHSYRAADCSDADFSGSNLQFARFVRTNLNRAKVIDCLVFGASVWGASVQDTTQRNLRVSGLDEPALTVDSLAMAQFIHLITHERSLRDVLQQITSKVVLLLGRFGNGGHDRLVAVGERVRARGLCPVIFDWEPPAGLDLEEVVGLLASLSAFVLIDLTDPQSTPAELKIVADHVKSVPIQPIVRDPQRPFSMFDSVRHNRPCILAPVLFTDDADLTAQLDAGLIDLCLRKRDELAL